MQIEGESSALRNLKLFGQVESNSQFLTVMRRALNNESGRQLPLYSTYIAANSESRLDYLNFIQAFVQAAYLIYTCKYYGLNPYIDLEDVRIEESHCWGADKSFFVVIYYRFNDGVRDANSYSIIVKHIYKQLLDSYRVYAANVKPNQVDVDFKPTMDAFQSQLAIIEARLNQLPEAQRERDFFFYLQETNLFRQYSMLLKIKNASMLDFVKLKFERFAVYRDNDARLVEEYNNEKKKIKCDIEELRKKEKLIEKNIIEFFQEITKVNPRYKFKIEAVEANQNNYKTKFIFTAHQVPQQFTVRLARLAPMQGDSMPQQAPIKERCPYLEYQIEYNSERNSICVRLVMSSILTCGESLDYILFQSNVLTFESANISLEFVEDKSSEKTQASQRKTLSFRGSSCFNNKEPTLQKILLLMDLTMTAAKTYEPELLSIRRNMLIDRDPHKLATIYQKVNHYTKVFLRCAKKVYGE